MDNAGGRLMLRRQLSLIAIVPLLVALASPVLATTPADPTSPQLDGLVHERLGASGIPGAAVAVVRAGETIHLAGYGRADATGRTVTPDTPFLLGSVTKPFTATAIFQLARTGVVDLEDEVTRYLVPAIGAAAAVFDGVTLHHLIDHTSGLPMSLGLPGSVPVRTGGDALVRRVVDLAEQYDPQRNPGAEYEYSNANYILLAQVVEQVTGESFAQYVERHVFDALGMPASFATDRSGRAAGLADGHERWFGVWLPAAHPYDPAGAAMGYMGSTARDMATFLTAQLAREGHAALQIAVRDMAETSVTPTGWDVPLERAIADGWFVDELAGYRTISHAGSLGNYVAHAIFVPEADGLGIAVLQNASAFIAAGHEGQYDLSLALARQLLGDEPVVAARDPLMTVVVPLIAWALAGLTVALALRHLVQRQRARHRAGPGMRSGKVEWRGSVAYLLLGATILIGAPALAGTTWATARLFYPDAAWGLFAFGVVAVASGVTRLAVSLADVRAMRVIEGTRA